VSLPERVSSLEKRMDELEEKLVVKLDALIKLLSLQSQLTRKDYWIVAGIAALVACVVIASQPQ